MSDEPTTLIEELDIALAVGGLSPAQEAIIRTASHRIAELEARLDAVVKHGGETMRLLQWDELGWDVPEEVIESLDKCLKAAVEVN